MSKSNTTRRIQQLNKNRQIKQKSETFEHVLSKILAEPKPKPERIEQCRREAQSNFRIVDGKLSVRKKYARLYVEILRTMDKYK